VHLVHEPDNRNNGVLGWLGTGVVGSVPSLVPGANAPDYRRMWRLAFAGGWPERGAPARVADALKRVSLARRLPMAVRVAALRRAVDIGVRQPAPGPVVLVKSVSAHFALDWIVDEFDPTLIVVWRHPLNVVPSWLQLHWEGAEFIAARPAIPARFESTALWPPPTDRIGGTAWAACAQLTILLESAARHPAALVLNHEANTIDPESAARALLGQLGLDWHDALAGFIEDSNKPGEGWATDRVTSEEPSRWKTRLAADDAARVLGIIEEFERYSPVAAAQFPASPAVAG
jgi:hypothetical protein